MNQEFGFNDTFDNLTFCNTEHFITKIAPKENLKSAKSHNAHVRNSGERNFKADEENVSVDDSVFFGASFSFEIDSCQNISCSEELFTEINEDLGLPNDEQLFAQNRTNLNSVKQEQNESSQELDLNASGSFATTAISNSLKQKCSYIRCTDSPEQDGNCDPESEKFVKTTSPTNASHSDVLENCNSPEHEVLPTNCTLAAWGLPDSILQKYENRKIVNMFPWQVECLNTPNVLENLRNLVYSAPTSAGKTLVAEILAIKTVLERRKKVLFILPFVSVVREKMFYFQDIFSSCGVRVEGFMGSHNPPGGFQAVQIAICTIEKANSLVNRLLEEGKLSDIGIVIVDEMHLLGDSSRGYLLELLLTKLRYMSLCKNDIQIQIVGMSATLPNLHILAKWLDAELYTTTFRPIPLNEQVHVLGEMYDKNLKLERRLTPLTELDADTDNIFQLCLETITNSCSVLIFCPTKNWCENLAQQIAAAFWKLGGTKTSLGEILREQLNTTAIYELLAQLRRCPVGLDSVLKKVVSFAVAFHHAGLTMDERDIIEGAFRLGTLRVLVATSTLSSGVNLPARRVIIRTAMFHGKPIDTLTYRQMIGRAGRMGKDTAGESILICQKNDYQIAKDLMSSYLKPIESCLEGSGRLKRAILEVIVGGVACTPTHVDIFTKCTLLAVAEENQVLVNPIKEAVEFLLHNEFIRLQKTDDDNFQYVASPLGKACLSSSMPPEEGLALFTELEKARQCFVLETELHLIYLVTPYSACFQWGNLDWMLFLDFWEKLPASMKRVGELVGIRESYIISGTRGKIQPSNSKLYQKLILYKRFFTSLALQDLVNEVPLNQVANKFNCSRGMLQSLQQSASTFAGMVTAFSRQLGWSSVEILISQFQDRLQFGISRDLLNLMRLPILNGLRARALFNGSIETLVHLAAADVCTVENILRKAVPFESEKERESETEYAAQQRNKVRGIWITGKEGVTEREAAVMLIDDARHFLKLEMGLTDAKWDLSVKEGRNNSSILVEANSLSATSSTTMSSKLNSHKERLANKSYNKTEEKASSSASYNSSICPSTHMSEELEFAEEGHAKKNQKTNISSDDIDQILKSMSLNSKILDSSDRSLFEESFTNKPNFVSKQLICSKDASALNVSMHEGSSSTILHSNSSTTNDSGLDFPTSTFLENAFVASFNLSETESKQEITEMTKVSNVSDDCIGNSQNEIYSSSPLNLSMQSLMSSKLFNKSRKRYRGEASKENITLDQVECEFLKQTPSKKKKMVTGNSKSKNNISKSFTNLSRISKRDTETCIDFTKIEIVDVCGDALVYQSFCEELYEQSLISLSIACKKIEENKPAIGLYILRKHSSDMCDNPTSSQIFVHGERQVVGICMTWGKNITYYISFENTTVIQNDVKIELLKKAFGQKCFCARIFDCKEQLKVLKMCCDVDFFCTLEDPKVGDWLLDPEGKEKNLQAMTLKFLPEAVSLTCMVGNCKGVGSVALDLYSCVEPRIRASVEAITTWHLVDSIKDTLVEQNERLLQTYVVEMNSMLCLTNMELNGLGVNITILQELADSLKQQTLAIEKEAYALAGRHFSFVSSTDVAKILGLYKGRKVSTSKKVLEHNDHPIASLILQWRKISSTLTKMIYPLIRAVNNNRIYGCCVTHTATGRITMHEPNLQTIARDFDVIDPTTKIRTNISCRKAFVSGGNSLLFSADYCQLELRLLAHLSKDPLLCSIMKTGEDVFKAIAAKWNKIEEAQVDDVLRHHTKQLCYGIIYGMGTRSLAEELSISEEEAVQLVDSFYNTYKEIKKYVNETVAKCRELCYVETLAGRRRYIPNIIHQNPAIRSQAERQAVNTTVQGSAADIAKTSMMLVENRFQEKFRYTKNCPKLVLHLHDELVYEVPVKYLTKTARIVKKCMEQAVELSVPFPVKLKSGSSWGDMKELVL